MSKTTKFIPLFSLAVYSAVIFADAFIPSANFNENLITPLIFAALGSSAAVGFAKYWRKNDY